MRFRRVGATEDREVAVRIISATHRDLGEAVAKERFRLDLYHRLDVFHLEVPPLRERPEDLRALASLFARETARKLGRNLSGISDAAAEVLADYHFPGNVRELKNVMERAVILETSDQVQPESIILRGGGVPARRSFFAVEAEGKRPPSMETVERRYMARVLEHAGGNKTRAAKLLGVSVPTLRKKLDG